MLILYNYLISVTTTLSYHLALLAQTLEKPLAGNLSPRVYIALPKTVVRPTLSLDTRIKLLLCKHNSINHTRLKLLLHLAIIKKVDHEAILES